MTNDDLQQRMRLIEELGLDGTDAEFDAFARDLARAAETPYAMVNLITHEQKFVGLACPASDLPRVGRTMPRDHGYCPEVIERRTALVLPDVRAHPRFASNPVVDQLGIATYVGAPLIHEETGIVLGTVCAIGTTARSLSTGQASLSLIKDHRDAVMQRINQRISRAR